MSKSKQPEALPKPALNTRSKSAPPKVPSERPNKPAYELDNQLDEYHPKNAPFASD